MRIIPYRTTDNLIVGVLLTLVDITRQKIGERNLAKSNESLNLVLENIPAVPYTCTLDPELEFSFIGKSCEKVTGFLPEQLIGKTSLWIRRVHPADKKKTITAYSSVAEKGNDDQTVRWKCADGKYKQFINYIRYVAGEAGNLAYISGVWQEVVKSNLPLKDKN